MVKTTKNKTDGEKAKKDAAPSPPTIMISSLNLDIFNQIIHTQVEIIERQTARTESMKKCLENIIEFQDRCIKEKDELYMRQKEVVAHLKEIICKRDGLWDVPVADGEVVLYKRRKDHGKRCVVIGRKAFFDMVKKYKINVRSEYYEEIP